VQINYPLDFIPICLELPELVPIAIGMEALSREKLSNNLYFT